MTIIKCLHETKKTLEALENKKMKNNHPEIRDTKDAEIEWFGLRWKIIIKTFSF